jgi:tripartite-type tricarboxylate transporter receptor subunit TctC
VFVAALSDKQVYDAIAKGAYETSPSTPAELAAEIRSAYDKWGAMIRQIGFQKQ